MGKKKKQSFEVQGVKIEINEKDYISLTDIAKGQSDKRSSVLIGAWLQNQKTLQFLEAWETVHNEKFKGDYMVTFRMEAADVRSNITPKKFIDETGAIGLISKQGKYGGTYAHKDLAIAFCYWINPTFQVYFIKEFERLKSNEIKENTKRFAWNKVLNSALEIHSIAQMVQELDSGEEE